MNIDITRLKSGIDDQIKLDEIISFSDEYESSDILSLDDVKVVGSIDLRHNDCYYLDILVKGNMILPSSVTLEPVDHPFEFKIVGDIDEMLAEINESSKKTQNSIDILPIIWENILMEIPMRVVGENETPLAGDGWKLITEEENQLNPELQKLKDLLK